MRSRWSTIVASIGMLAGLAGSYPTPALAQWPRTVLLRPAAVRNLDEPGRNPYMDFLVLSCSGGDTSSCDVVFHPVPDGKRLVLEQVNVSIDRPAGAVDGVKRIAVLRPAESIIVLPTSPSPDPNLLIVNQRVLTYYESGQTPMLQISLRDDVDAALVTASLSGHFVDLDP